MRRIALILPPLLFACSLVPQAGPEPATSLQPTASLLPAVTSPPTLPPPTPTASPVPAPSAFPEPASFEWVLVGGGLDSPVDVQDSGDGRLMVVEQAGVIREVTSDGSSVFLDIRDRVGSSGNEQGLLGLAFVPGAAGDFVVNYTDRQGDTVVARFRQQDGLADPASERVLLRVQQPFPNHNGGGIAFGPDGYLYIGAGDGGAAGDPQERAQNPETLLGKLLRLDLAGGDPYAIPPDNPFANGGGLPEIWALGLRNPWRFSFDSQTGDLFIADVGQNQWEEIDHLPPGAPGGANFGWDFLEGFEPYERATPGGLTGPVAVYSHAEGCSVTGGVVVRDPALPEWSGVYLYGDFCSGAIWGLFQSGDGSWANRQLFATPMRITSFGTGADGEVYVLDRNGGVYRLSRR